MGHTTKQAKLWFFQREEQEGDGFSLDRDSLSLDLLPPLRKNDPHAEVYTVVVFSSPITCCLDDLFLGSRLDMQGTLAVSVRQ
jgi:hypothetical protein